MKYDYLYPYKEKDCDFGCNSQALMEMHEVRLHGKIIEKSELDGR